MDNFLKLWGIVITLLVLFTESQGSHYKRMEPSAELSSNVHFHSRRGRCFFGGGDDSQASSSQGGNSYNDDSKPRPETEMMNWYRNRPARNSISNKKPNFVHQFRSLSGNSQLSSDATYKFYPYAVAVPYPTN